MKFYAKGISNERYTPEFKKLVIETMWEEKLSYSETAQRFEVNDHHRIQEWGRIYLTEGAEGFTIDLHALWAMTGWCRPRGVC